MLSLKAALCIGMLIMLLAFYLSILMRLKIEGIPEDKIMAYSVYVFTQSLMFPFSVTYFVYTNLEAIKQRILKNYKESTDMPFEKVKSSLEYIKPGMKLVVSMFISSIMQRDQNLTFIIETLEKRKKEKSVIAHYDTSGCIDVAFINSYCLLENCPTT